MNLVVSYESYLDFVDCIYHLSCLRNHQICAYDFCVFNHTIVSVCGGFEHEEYNNDVSFIQTWYLYCFSEGYYFQEYFSVLYL